METKFDATHSPLMDAIQSEIEARNFEVLRSSTRELCVPIIGEEKGYLVITFKVPKDENNSNPYADKIKAKTEKKELIAKKKAAREAKIREAGQ